MASSPSSQNYTCEQCFSGCSEYYKDDFQENLESPMPWIGMYIAAASAVCAVAMSIDTINGFRSKKLWVPCKYFSLNAFSLTVLAVALKLPVDLTSQMEGTSDRLVRVSSLVLMSTSMSNFITSLGNNEVMLNLAALGILVITVAANVCIRLFQIQRFLVIQDDDYLLVNVLLNYLVEEMICVVFLLLMLVILCCTAVMVPTVKTYFELRYNQMHIRISNDEQLAYGKRKLTTDKLRVEVRRYWVMAETGSPQFVIAGSVTCVTSSLMCLFTALTLLESYIRLYGFNNFSWYGHSKQYSTSNYKWSTHWILVIQSIGVALSTIAPLLRWFTAAQLKSTNIGQKSFKDELKVEAYWTQRLKHWRDSPLPLKTQHLKFRKVVHDAKRLLLNFWIGAQVLIVWVSKLVLLVSAVFVKGLLFCFSHTNYLMERDSKESGDSNDFSPYILRLEGEAELPKRTLKNICNEVDKLIEMGKKKQSKSLIKLLKKSVNFNGVREFDSSAIQSLSSQEPPNCWSLSIVTLTSIAISLANVTNQKSDQLLNVVGEGLYFAKLVDKTTDTNSQLTSIINTADVVWVGVELYRKWQDKDLKEAGLTHKEKLNELSNIAKKTVIAFTTDTNNFLVQDPFNWPATVIAANSMYRITQTILLALGSQTDNELFERLSIMIADILAACLANLACAIRLMCRSNVVKEREKSISQAALLLGESEEILQILEHRELPNLDLEKVATIESWRAFMEEQNKENPVASVYETFQQTFGVGHVSIELPFFYNCP